MPQWNWGVEEHHKSLNRIAEATKCFYCKVTNKNSQNSLKSLICLNNGIYKVRKTEIYQY